MKKVLATLSFVALFLVVAQAQTSPVAAPATKVAEKVGGPIMTFEKMEVDYGTIAQGADPLRKFKFKNTGTEPLVINNARGSCGCTVPAYKKEPIMPGETGEIEVRYDTQRVGPFTKQITVETNEGPNARMLVIKGEVNEKKQEAGAPAMPSLISAPKQ